MKLGKEVSFYQCLFALDDEISNSENELDTTMVTSNSALLLIDMFRLLLLGLCMLPILLINGQNIPIHPRQVSSTRQPFRMKICGTALVQMLDMICQRAREFLLEKQRSSTLEKRQTSMDDDPYTRTLWIKDSSQFQDTLIGDCCLQACTVRTLLKYC